MMKFNLIQNAPFTFPKNVVQIQETQVLRVCAIKFSLSNIKQIEEDTGANDDSANPIMASIAPFVSPLNQDDVDHIRRLITEQDFGITPPQPDQLNSEIDLAISMGSEPNADFVQITSLERVNIFDKLKTVFHLLGLKCKLQITIRDLAIVHTFPDENIFECKTNLNTDGDGDVDRRVETPIRCSPNWNKSEWFTINYDFHAQLTISVIVYPINQRFLNAKQSCTYQHVLSLNKKIFDEKLCTDATIVLNGGAEIKFNKAFLSAFVDKNGRDELAKETKFELDFMGKEAANALLAYLYYGKEIDDKRHSPSTIVEILRASYRLKMPAIQDKMQNVVLSKLDSWFQLKDVLELFLLSNEHHFNNLADPLLLKSVQILKGEFQAFKKTPEYANLFLTNPTAVMKLVECFAQLKSSTS